MSNNSTVATSCFGNQYKDDVSFLKEHYAKELNRIYKTYQGIYPLPLAIIGLFFSVVYCGAVLRAIKQRRVSRKCYVLLLNRSFGDCFACIMAIIISTYNLSVPVVSRELTQLLDVLFMSSIWSAMVSYVALSLIKLFAVWKPLQYRKQVTMMRCIYLIALSWLIFAAFAAYAVIALALTRIPVLNRWSGCRMETCVRIMYRARNITVVLVYCLTILSFVFTVIFIRRARKFMNQNHRKTTKRENEGTPQRQVSLKDRFPLYKLAINVGSFAIFHCVYPIFAAMLVVRTLDACFFLLHFNSMMIFLGCVRISLLLRASIDPLVAFLTDVQVRRGVVSLFRLESKIEPMSSTKRLFFRGRTQQSMDNSSEAEADIKPQKTHKNTTSTYITDRASVFSDQQERAAAVKTAAAAAAKARVANAGTSLKTPPTVQVATFMQPKAKEEGDQRTQPYGLGDDESSISKL